MLAGYLECGLGFAGASHEFIIELEFVTRSGDQMFLLGLDASSPLKADILTVEDSSLTCLGAKNDLGGSNMDYFIISRSLLAAVRSLHN